MNAPTPVSDSLTHWLDRSARLRVVAVDATRAARGLCLLHDLEGDAARQFAAAIAGGLLFACDLKSLQTLSLQIEVGARVYHVDATADSLVRGMATTRAHEAPVARVAVRRFGQKGLLYQSIVDVATLEVSKALEGHFLQSEQQVLRTDLRCDLDERGLPTKVHGALVRGFPGTPPEMLRELLEAWDRRGDWDPSEPCRGLDERIWDRLAEQDVHHHCPCSKDRALASVRALGLEALEQAAKADETLEVVCDFCRSVYRFGADDFLPSDDLA
jgi:molecular chaperone Hsp33